MTSVAKKMPEAENQKFADELQPGTTLLRGQFVIEKFLNSGGFGITYLARDSLKRLIVIKECFPSSFCRRSNTAVGARSRAHQVEFRSIVKLFMQEAFNLAKLKHPHIVGVHQVFEDNDTAYMAMDFIEGFDLQESLGDDGEQLTPVQIMSVLDQILDAVGFIHKQDVLHRDISPDNILIDKKSGNPVLIDFGAAREEVSKASRALSEMRVVKDGYSPQEFYINGSAQGPSSDLYALAATFYHLITKDAPPNAQMRLSAIASKEPDPYVPIRGKIPGYPEAFLAAIDKAMNVFPKDRLQSADAWIAMIDQKSTAKLAPAPRVKSRLVSTILSSKTAPNTVPAKSMSRTALLGSCAVVIAVLFGIVATQTDLISGVAADKAADSKGGVTIALSSPKPAVVMAETKPNAPSAPVAEASTSVASAGPVAAPAPATATQVVKAAPVVASVPPSVTSAVVPAPEVKPVSAAPAEAPVATAVATAVEPTPAVNPAGAAPAVVSATEAIAAPKANQTAPTADASLMAQYYTVRLPFAGTPGANNVISAVTDTAPDWMQPGQRIIKVNGTAIQADDDVAKVISETKNLAGLSDAKIAFEIEAFAGADPVKRDQTLPVVQMVRMANGISFEVSNSANGPVTTVIDAPAGSDDSGLKVGDVLFANMADASLFSIENTLADVLTREITRKAETLSVAVQRDGARFMASFSLTAKS